MAHGALLGQTPILNAEGIEYDNSTTSGVITANNVQQAIDESVKKIENIENNGLSWELLFDKSVNQTYSTHGKESYTPVINNVLSDLNPLEYVFLNMVLTGTISVPTSNSYGGDRDRFGLELSDSSPSSSKTKINMGYGSNLTNTFNTTYTCVNTGFNQNYISNSYSLFEQTITPFKQFFIGNSLYLLSYLPDPYNRDREVTLNIEFKIYGLKRPTF